MSSNVELPDTSGYSKDNVLLPWKRLDYSKNLRVLPGDRQAAIKYAINWVYSSGQFPCYTDYYAAGAWAVLAHGLACRRNDLPTSDWIYGRPREWKVTITEANDRVNRAFLKFPAATAIIVASKAKWWYGRTPPCCSESSLCATFKEREIVNDLADMENVIGHWASTRKVLALAGVKGLIEECDAFGDVPQQLKIEDRLRPYFLRPSGLPGGMEPLFDANIRLLLKYWPRAGDISCVLRELQTFAAKGASYHEESEFLAGKPRETLQDLPGFLDKVGLIQRVMSQPELYERKWFKTRLEAFDEEFMRGLIRSGKASKVEEFLAAKSPTIADDVVEAFMKEIRKLQTESILRFF